LRLESTFAKTDVGRGREKGTRIWTPEGSSFPRRRRQRKSGGASKGKRGGGGVLTSRKKPPHSTGKRKGFSKVRGNKEKREEKTAPSAN